MELLKQHSCLVLYSVFESYLRTLAPKYTVVKANGLAISIVRSLIRLVVVLLIAMIQSILADVLCYTAQ